VRRVLITGMSGTGKSTALVELEQRGFRVVDTDSPEWSEWIAEEGEWLWREDRMAELLAADGDAALFVSGCVSNQGKFYDRFDAVVLLSAPAEVVLQRVDRRTTNDYGKTARERDLILHHLETVEPLLRTTATHELDASRSIGEVVDELVEIASRRAP
jgi:dephospho-CoA kinase